MSERGEEYLDPGFRQHQPLFGHGRPGFELLLQFLTTFPDLAHVTEVVWAQADLVVARSTWRGRQFGSGKQLELRILHTYRIRRNRLAEHWAAVDYAALEQFGVTRPAPGEEPELPPGGWRFAWQPGFPHCCLGSADDPGAVTPGTTCAGSVAPPAAGFPLAVSSPLRAGLPAWATGTPPPIR